MSPRLYSVLHMVPAQTQRESTPSPKPSGGAPPLPRAGARAQGTRIEPLLSSETLQLAATGDRVAVEAFVRRYRGELVSFARQRNAAEPEAMVFAALDQTLQRLPTLYRLTDRSVRAYLFQIVRGALSDEHRLRQKRPATPLHEEDLETELLEPGPEDNVIDRDVLATLLQQLSPRDKDIITRRFLLDQGYSQIADELDLDESTVRKAKSRALNRLQALAVAAGLLALLIGILTIVNAGSGGQQLDTTPADDITDGIENGLDDRQGGLLRTDGPVQPDGPLPPPDANLDRTNQGLAPQPRTQPLPDVAEPAPNLNPAADPNPNPNPNPAPGVNPAPEADPIQVPGPGGGPTPEPGRPPDRAPPAPEMAGMALILEHSGKCLEVAGAGQANGANLQQRTCVNISAQRFEVIPIAGDVFSLRAVHSGKCVDVEGPGGQEGANLRQWTCNRGENQQFRWQGASLASVREDKCLDQGLSQLDGGNVYIWKCLNVPQQRIANVPGADDGANLSVVRVYEAVDYQGASWGLGTTGVSTAPAAWEGQVSSLSVPDGLQLRACTQPDGGGTCTVYRGSVPRLAGSVNNNLAYFEIVPMPAMFSLAAEHSSQCVTVADGDTGQVANVTQQPCGAGSSQQFQVISLSPGVFSLRAVSSGQCLAVSDYIAGGTNIQQMACNGGYFDQQFRWRGASLVLADRGQCVDIDGAKVADGANVQVWDCVDVPQQRFTVSG